MSDNVGSAGGGVAVFGDARVVQSTIRGNQSGYGYDVFGGGGIYAAGGLVLRHSRVVDNEDADLYGGQGGGIQAGGDVSLIESHIVEKHGRLGYYGAERRRY